MAFKPFYRRRFLNRRGHHAGAYVIADCALEEYGDRLDIEAYVTVADCSRVVTLDFSGRTPSQRSNSLHKARELKVVLDDFCAALEAAETELSKRDVPNGR
jgi:hypothetical protein